MMEAFFILGLLCEQEIQLPSLILGNVAMTKRIPASSTKTGLAGNDAFGKTAKWQN
jgi:hypothetical protein